MKMPVPQKSFLSNEVLVKAWYFNKMLEILYPFKTLKLITFLIEILQYKREDKSINLIKVFDQTTVYSIHVYVFIARANLTDDQ